MMSEIKGFFGDERFVEEIEERVEGDREIALPVPRAKLSILQSLVARAYGGHRERPDPSGTAAKMDGSEIDVGVLGTGVGESERKGAWEAIASGSFGN